MDQSKEKKVIFILIDGLGDLSMKKQGYLTPLQMINKPHLDAMAYTGLTGVQDPVEPGLACGSDTAHMSIFGYDPFTLYRGRGAFETMGSGIPMSFTDIAFKCNFSHLDEMSGLVKLRRVDRAFDQWGLPLIDALNDKYLSVFEENDTHILAKHATEHRLGLRISNKFCCDKITGTDPLKDNLPLQKSRPTDTNDEKSVKSAQILNKVSDWIQDQLRDHPINVKRKAEGKTTANLVLLRGCGSRIKVKSFEEQTGFKGFMIAPTAIINGIGQTIGLDIIKVEGATGDYHTNLLNKGKAAFQNLSEDKYNFCFLHIKAVDDAGHDKNLELKKKFLQEVDRMIGEIIRLYKQASNKFELVLVLTGDHTTPISVGDHTFEPVPFMISSISAVIDHLNGDTIQNKLKDKVEKFDEIECSRGGLGRFTGGQIMSLIQNYIKFGVD